MTIPSEIPCCALAFWLSFSSPQMLVPHCRSQYVPHLTFSFAAQVLEAAKFASAAKKKLDELIKAAQEKSEQAIEDEKRVAAVRAFNAGPHPHLSLSRCSGREPTRMLCFAACVLLALASLVILTWGGT